MKPHSFSIRKMFSAFIIPVVICSVYYVTLSPTIAGGDSGELVAEGCILGTAHPPGYPLFTMIVYVLKSFFSIGDTTVAFRVNVLSAAVTSLACLFMGLTVESINPDSSSTVAGSLFAQGMFAFSPLIWQYAVTAEVFPLNTMFAASIVYLVVKFSQSKSIKYAYLGAFVCGLALCNQHTIILYEAPLILWMLILLRKTILRDIFVLVYLAVLFILGLSPYLYLPIVAHLAPKPGSWGYLSTWSGFLHHFLRKDYGTFQLFSGATGKDTEKLWERNGAYLKDVNDAQGLQMVPWLAFIGMISWCFLSYYRQQQVLKAVISKPILLQIPKDTGSQTSHHGRSKKKTQGSSAAVVQVTTRDVDVADEVISSMEAAYTPFMIIFTQLFYFAVFHSLSNLPLTNKLLYGVHQRFWMQPNVVLFTWAGIGFHQIFTILVTLLEKLFLERKTQTGPSRVNSLFINVIRTISVFVALGCVVMQYQKNMNYADQSKAFYFRDYASAILGPLPQNAILLVNYDMQWTSIRYMQKCEHFREDITAINLSMMTYPWFQFKHNLYPNIVFPGLFHSSATHAAYMKAGAFTMTQFLNANINRSNIFLSGRLSFPDGEMNRYYDLVPTGLVSAILSIDRLPNGTAYKSTNQAVWLNVSQYLRELPDVDKYPEETWEWTIGRNFKDQVSETSAFHLQAAIPVAAVDPMTLVESIYWLESAILLEEGNPGTSLLKNAGLGHLHLLQNKVIDTFDRLPFPTVDVFNSLAIMNWPSEVKDDWKKWSSDRFLAYWSAFLRRPDARSDSQYATIKGMYDKVAAVAQQKKKLDSK